MQARLGAPGDVRPKGVLSGFRDTIRRRRLRHVPDDVIIFRLRPTINNEDEAQSPIIPLYLLPKIGYQPRPGRERYHQRSLIIFF